MAHYPAHMSKTEKTICNRLFRAIHDHPDNLHLRIYDGEDWATEWTRDLSKVFPEIHATDATRVFLMAVSPEGAANRIGSILLIHGNEEDVISDFSWNSKNPQNEAILDHLCKIANAEH